MRNKEQQTLKYIDGPKYSIQEYVAIQDVLSIDEAGIKI